MRDVWMAPVQRRIVAGCTKKVVKKKVLRKVARKSSREEESPNNSSGQKTSVGTHGVNGDSTVPADANGKAEGREKGENLIFIQKMACRHLWIFGFQIAKS